MSTTTADANASLPPSTTSTTTSTGHDHGSTSTSTSSKLTDVQAQALFQYLTQAQTWHEFSSLKYPGRISHSGAPFVPDPRTPTRPPSPILNTLFRRLFLTLPGIRAADARLWRVHAQGVLEDMAVQDLSDSYDKGVLSKRKIVAYGIVVVASYAARGYLGGLPKKEDISNKVEGQGGREYDPDDVEDVLAAWQSVREGLVYGDDVDRLLDWAAKTNDLSELPTRYQAAHRFASLTFASFLHYTFVTSPTGPALRTLVQRVHAMLPYGLVRQALRVGNVASMVNAVLKIFLYRAPSIRGWFKGGGTPHQNLLQSIISTVLASDQSALEKRLAALPITGTTQAQRDAIDAYVFDAVREDRQEAREASRSSETSIVGAIMAWAGVEAPSDTGNVANAGTSDGGGESPHELLFQRLGLQLGIRDRARMGDVLCGRIQRSAVPETATPGGGSTPATTATVTPSTSTATGPDIDAAATSSADTELEDDNDHLTSAVRLIVRAFEPLLRRVHKVVDLGAALGDFQAFLDDLLSLPAQASAKEYAEVVRRHEGRLHRFLHPLAKDEEVRGWYREWYRGCVGVYRRGGAGGENGGTSTAAATSGESTHPNENMDTSLAKEGAGHMQPVLDALLSELSEQERAKVLEEADRYAGVLRREDGQSDGRMRALFERNITGKGGGGGLRAPSPTPSRLSVSSEGGGGKKRGWFGSASSKSPRGSLDSPSLSASASASRVSLDGRSSTSATRTSMDNAASGASAGPAGPAPGLWLAHWQHLVDYTPVTPATLHGPVRYGGEKAVRERAAVVGVDSVDAGASGGGAGAGIEETAKAAGEEWPQMTATEGLLRERFERVLIERWM